MGMSKSKRENLLSLKFSLLFQTPTLTSRLILHLVQKRLLTKTSYLIVRKQSAKNAINTRLRVKQVPNFEQNF